MILFLYYLLLEIPLKSNMCIAFQPKSILYDANLINIQQSNMQAIFQPDLTWSHHALYYNHSALKSQVKFQRRNALICAVQVSTMQKFSLIIYFYYICIALSTIFQIHKFKSHVYFSFSIVTYPFDELNLTKVSLTITCTILVDVC